MRAHRAARTVGALTLGATLAGAAACGTGTEDKATACKNMRAAVESNAKQLSSPQELAQVYAKVAAKIRSEADKVGDLTVKAAGQKVASDLDTLADQMKSLAAGKAVVPDAAALGQAVVVLNAACG
ncbi:MAG TPA: hypothetical protein VNW94_17010 [Streptosporangiaceae bacterium]|jgi:hypothetical protein|nr:hypothetical protein [Streptosporangiaceae bacterium]